MSRIAIENGQESRFLRVEDKVKLGGSHLLMVIETVDDDKFLEIDAEDTEKLRKNLSKVIKRKFNNDSTMIDMGMILREKDQIIIEKKSETFDYPNSDIFEATRTKTIEAFQKQYPEEIIRRRDLD